MYKLNTPRSSAGMIALLLAGCGGGGSDGTAVSNGAEAPAVAAAPAPAPSPAAEPPPAVAPADPEATPAPKVSGDVVWSALQTGISLDPRPVEPFTNYRKVVADDGTFLYFGGDPDSLESHTFTSSPWGSLMKEGLVGITLSGSDGVIDAVTVNDLAMVGPQLDLRNVDPVVDATAGTWSNGAWSAQLIIQSAESPELMRVCWNAHLPPPPPVAGPPGTPTVVYTVPLKRLMCGLYSRSLPGPDLGGYVEDDFNGTRRTFRGTWQD